MRLKYTALVFIGDTMENIFNNYFNLIDTVLRPVFMDFSSPFTYIFGGFFVLGLMLLVFNLIFGDR